MPSIFEDKSGYVSIVPGTATKALLRVQSINAGGAKGFLHPDVIFVTQFSTQRGINSNVSYSLDNRIFLSAAGDRLGSLKLRGLIFGSACGVIQGRNGAKSADYDWNHGGFMMLHEFYQTNRLVSGKQEMPYLEVFYGAGTEKHVGYLAGLVTGTSNLSIAAMDFTLDCLLVP